MPVLDHVPINVSVEPFPNTAVQRDENGAIKATEVIADTITGVVIAETYIHNQASAAVQWVITHNLDKYPAVAVVDSANRTVLSRITYTSLNTVTIDFSAAFAGKAFLN